MKASGFGSQRRSNLAGERGSSLLLVLCLAALLSLLAMSLFFTTDVDFRTSKSYGDRSLALSDTDTGLNELVWRLNLTSGAGAPPLGSTITVNGLVDYDAAIDYDRLNLMTNATDDDGDGTDDEPDELNLFHDWEVRILLSGSDTNPGSPWEHTDTKLDQDPWGDLLVEPTIQPSGTWKTYTVNDVTSPDVMLLRFKKDTDTTVGDSEGDGEEIVFYDPSLRTNGVEDLNTLSALGGNGNPADDSPYNITWESGGTTYPATGVPVLLARITARVQRGGREVARRRIEAELMQNIRPVIKKALCGCTELKLGGGGSTNSYRSSEGDYGVGPTYENGDIGSNGIIEMGGGYICLGSAESTLDQSYSGSNATVMHDGTSGGLIDNDHINVHGITTENKIPAPAPCECDAFDVAAMVASAETTNDNGNILPNNKNPYDSTGKVLKSPIYKAGQQLALSSDSTIILPGGDYFFEEIKLSGSASIQIGVDSNNDGLADGPPTSTVRIFVSGDINLSGVGMTNSARPTDVEIYCSGVGATISMSSSSEFRGMIYAPFADVDLTGKAEFFGAILGNSVKNSGGAAVHYDEDLGDRHTVIEEFRLLAWHEVP